MWVSRCARARAVASMRTVTTRPGEAQHWPHSGAELLPDSVPVPCARRIVRSGTHVAPHRFCGDTRCDPARPRMAPDRGARTTMSTERTTDPDDAPGQHHRRPRTTATPSCACRSRRESLARRRRGRRRHRRAHRLRRRGRRGRRRERRGVRGVVGRPRRRLGARRGDAIAAAEIPVGGGKVFEALKVVVTQPTAGRLQGVLRRVHAPGVHGRAASRTASSPARATAASSTSRPVR